MRNLIIGLGNLPFDRTEFFLASLHHIGYDGDVCLYTYDVSADVLDKFRSLGVIVGDGAPFIRPGRNLMNSRFFMILDFLSKFQYKYDNVLITDVRDVIFQSDPFLMLGGAEVIFSSEGALIRDCRINGAWVQQSHGYGLYENIRDHYISCAGTTIGTMSGILRYLTLMCDEMSTCKVIHTNIDQGIHNYIAHMRPVTNSIFDHEFRVVATLNHIPNDRIAVTARGVEVDGHIPALVHQWDRRGHVAHFVTADRRFRLLDTQSPVFGVTQHRSWSRPNRRADRNIVVAYVSRTDSARLATFLGELRTAGFVGDIVVMSPAPAAPQPDHLHGDNVRHIAVPDAGPDGPSMFARYRALGNAIEGVDGDNVLFFPTLGAEFRRDPFAGRAPGLSLFAEGPKFVRDCEHVSEWLQRAGIRPDHLFMQQVVSDRVIGGELSAMASLCARFEDFAKKQPDLVAAPEAARGLLNLIAWIQPLEGFPTTVHPNGSRAFMERWPAEIEVRRGPVLQVGGATPSMVLD